MSEQGGGAGSRHIRFPIRLSRVSGARMLDPRSLLLSLGNPLLEGILPAISGTGSQTVSKVYRLPPWRLRGRSNWKAPEVTGSRAWQGEPWGKMRHPAGSTETLYSHTIRSAPRMGLADRSVPRRSLSRAAASFQQVFGPTPVSKYLGRILLFLILSALQWAPGPVPAQGLRQWADGAERRRV